eukprot:TRINITY_DN8096_c1_g1_i1.p1 TRINITY_DN8096_c1_g1~~TRINITY_DN8096_c1_g1_i1.p1  ORF type:complete len:1003 (+),score=230.66 TRINITY_DN8096_c1_g1_i1:234-3011(+)
MSTPFALPLPPPPAGCRPPAQRFMRKRYAGQAVIAAASKLMEPTVSIQKKKRGKTTLDDGLVSFRAGGRSTGRGSISDRINYSADAYDSFEQAERELKKNSVNQFLYGDFLPAMKPAKPQLPPLDANELTGRRASRAKAEAIRNGPLYEGSSLRQERNSFMESAATASVDELHADGLAPENRTGHPHVGQSGAGPETSSGNLTQFDSNGSGESPEKAASAEWKPVALPVFEMPDTSAAEEAAANKRNAVKAIFKKVSEEGMLHKDDLAHALSLLGAAAPNPEWMDEISSDITKYASLDVNEFLEFQEVYFAKQRSAYKDAFESYDEDGSGSIDTTELQGLFKSFGIEPMTHVLMEAIGEVDEDGTGNLDFEEFEKVAEALISRAGFTKSEYDDFVALFERFDRDGSGTMESHEAWLALQWLGFPITKEEMDHIVSEIDKDKSGTMDQKEWVMCLQMMREKKIEHVKEVAKQNDTDGDGKIQYDELVGLVRAMGLIPDRDAIREAAEEAGISTDDDDVDIGELWRLLQVFRSHEGLSRRELDEVDSAFHRYADKVDKEVSIVDVGKVVRSIGYTMAFETQQKLVREVDIDNTGKLDISEFRKMIRLINRFDLNIFRLAFEEAAGTGTKRTAAAGSLKIGFAAMMRKQARRAQMASGKSLSVEEAKLGLRRVLGKESVGALEDLLTPEERANDEVDFYGFVGAAKRGQSLKRAAFRKCGGFNDAQVKRLKELFKVYDEDGSGEISGQECISLLEAEFPAIASDPKKRPQIQQLMKEADENGSGTFDFDDFLRLMRCFKDMHEQLQIKKELTAVAETGFSAAEVLDFRELFAAAAGGTGEMDFERVKAMLGGIVPMGSRNSSILRKKFIEVAQRSEGVHSDASAEEDMMDFPEFLWLMKALLDMDFANMNNVLGKKMESEAEKPSPPS